MRTITGPVRWGIIGVGDVTETKSGPGFQQAEGSELVAVMRRDGVRAADYARRHGVPRWYDDADALIADPDVDAVYIATPPDSHADYAIRVAAAGKPVYVEKPMARTSAECEAMIDAADRAGVPLFVAYYRRTLPRFTAVGTLLADGAIGTPRAVSVRLQRPAPTSPDGVLPWRLRPEVSGGGLFVDLGSHTLDLLDHLLGPVTDCSGVAAGAPPRSTSGTVSPDSTADDSTADAGTGSAGTGNVGTGNVDGTADAVGPLAEDVVAASFSFASGVHGTGLWLFDAAESLDEVEIVGDGGSLRFSSFGREPIRVVTPGGTREVSAPNPETVQLPLIQTVVDELTGRGRCPSTGRTALRTTRVIDTLLAGHRAAAAR
ncbi:Gfo/Idh/MocA family oxidoreductase [Cellulomonas sp. ATA003]|uniref:Gfo/Idh/MocA family protein n=1 Tax=Cellulomonas sp. ATA003 TaxID=3073064 RepID=UPI002873E4B6|nr:Gfo/Idh/MocA family oxidoreductase [Cellulomonas sp. ATA003]WNB86876.1 Gfo/Idh/MocA family oxidoreductase [Cellulomonas sp. ATA003]